MTDDAAALVALAQQVAELRKIVTSWAGRLDAATGGTMRLLLEVKHLHEQLDEALDKHRLKPPPAPWWCVSEAEGKVMLAGLREWVEGFARRHYPGYLARLPRCWANHPEAVWELSTLRAEWQRVYGDENNRDLQGALNWHDKLFPGVLGRLAAAIRCDETGCRVRPPPRA